VQADVLSGKREKNRLEGNHEMTKATLNTTRDTIESIAASVATLRQAMQGNEDRIAKTERMLVDSEKRVTDEMELRLNKQGRACKELNEKQVEVMKACEQAKSLGERANAALKKLTNEHESQKKHDFSTIEGLRGTLMGLEEKFVVLDQEVKTLMDKEKAIDREVQHLKTWIDKLQGIERLHADHSNTIALIREQTCKLESMNTRIISMGEESKAHREQHNVELNSIEKRIDRNMSDTTRWMDTQKAHVDLISSAGNRLEELELTRSKLLAFAETTEVEVQSMASWQRGAMNDLESHAARIATLCTDVSEVRQNVDGKGILLQELRNEFNSERDSRAKLGVRVDQCYKYFNGLGKGLQETQRQIANAEGGMLLPKLGNGTGLPVIPPAPKTPRGNSTPRKLKPPLAQ